MGETIQQQILELAIAAIERETDLRINVIGRRTQTQNELGVHEDAVLRLDGEEYVAEIKVWAQHTPLIAVVETVKRHLKGILVADYVNPKMADRLWRVDVQFIDTAGNAFIKTPLHHVRIKGNRKLDAIVPGAKPRKHRGFTATGLKVT